MGSWHGNVGKLYLCSTPIGNLEDITLRAIDTLHKVSLVAAEDTRKAKVLLDRYNISTTLTSYHKFNENKKSHFLITKLKEGQDIALISNAGTPGISDPGMKLINLCRENKIEVEMIPGACSLIVALVLSGFGGEHFFFEGFLPHTGKMRRRRLKYLSSIKGNIIIFLSPHRLLATLKDAVEILGNRDVFLARELTKIYEEKWWGSLESLIQRIETKSLKGEMILVIDNND